MRINEGISAQQLLPQVEHVFTVSASKIRSVAAHWHWDEGSPVYTVRGRYTARGWTEWTQGFQFGMAVLQFDATNDEEFLTLGRDQVVKYMASHVTHVGVHDHGFNQISTYGNLRRLMREGRLPWNEWELRFYEMALRTSGAVQANRWAQTASGDGYIYSFNGPHSLFVDTMRSLRVLGLAHQLGQVLLTENDRRVSLLDRLIQHARTTLRYNVYYGEGRDRYDVPGRVAHESIFNPVDGSYRCPSTQQGYSPFSTWTRGLAWAILGSAEILEFIAALPGDELANYGGKEAVVSLLTRGARVTADFYIENTAADGVPYWDTGAPGLTKLGDWRDRPADPYNAYEPVDSSAAAIAAQGLIRLGRYLTSSGDVSSGSRYEKAGLTTAAAIFTQPYLCEDPDHQGLLLHSVYHRPKGWDYVPPNSAVPCGEACMWGDYHTLELGVLIQRLGQAASYPVFFDLPV